MKLKLLSTLIAASFLAGCSSSGSSDNGGTGPAPQDGIADVQYLQGEEFDAALITGDAGDYNALIVRDQTGEGSTHVLIDGNIYSVEEGQVVDSQGNVMGTLITQGDTITYQGVIKGELVEVTLTVVDGRLMADGTIVDTPPKWGDEGATSISIVEEGESKLIYIGEEHIGTINELGTIIKDDKAIGEFEGDRHNGSAYFYDGSTVNFTTDELNGHTTVTVKKDGMIYTWNSATGEKSVSIDENIDNEWGLVDPEFGLGFEFELVDDNKLVISLGASEVTITDTPVGIIVSGSEGETAVSVKTANAYKEAMTHLTPNEQKFLAIAFVANEGKGAVSEEMRDKAWHTTKDITAQWAQDNKLTMLKIANIEMDLKGNSLGYYLLTGERKTVQELKDTAKDKITEWLPTRPELTAEQKHELRSQIQSLSQEQRQQIKQAIKDRASRS
ncbi:MULTISPECIES: hypothetical protein [Vibrio]|uniref:hypothetical protein n=1 Tax=Vibrio TaxID=662 RepID=UPI001ABF74D4|nr:MULTISPECIES: hypothetical protein [Vibrio]